MRYRPSKRTGKAEDVYKRQGYGSVTHFYLQETGQIPDNAAAFVGIGDYLAMQLTGSRKAVVHKTMAASFGGCHLEDGRFELKKLAAAGVNISYYPDVYKRQSQEAPYGIQSLPGDQNMPVVQNRALSSPFPPAP